jgi:hypothetical protein
VWTVSRAPNNAAARGLGSSDSRRYFEEMFARASCIFGVAERAICTQPEAVTASITNTGTISLDAPNGYMGLSFQGCSGQSVKLATELHVVSRLRYLGRQWFHYALLGLSSIFLPSIAGLSHRKSASAGMSRDNCAAKYIDKRDTG